jgi:hypothetical protein
MRKTKVIPLAQPKKRKPRAVNMTYRDLSENRVSVDELELRPTWIRLWDRIIAEALLSPGEMGEAA